MLKLILLGPPGSGKGTQAQRLVETEGATHISTGDLLRAEVAAGTTLGRRVKDYQAGGELVPDELILELALPLVEAAGLASGYVLDGFPRSLGQARRLAEALSEPAAVHHVVLLMADPAVLVQRMRRRAAQEHRADDTDAVFQRRLAVYSSETTPLIDFYRERDLLVEVAADGGPDDVTAAVRAALELKDAP